MAYNGRDRRDMDLTSDMNGEDVIIKNSELANKLKTYNDAKVYLSNLFNDLQVMDFTDERDANGFYIEVPILLVSDYELNDILGYNNSSYSNSVSRVKGAIEDYKLRKDENAKWSRKALKMARIIDDFNDDDELKEYYYSLKRYVK